ncbi:MAG: 23S rRNA (guanosine(2251)-2'-O)-methyltransferase RlmB [Pseudomonadota bacterium]
MSKRSFIVWGTHSVSALLKFNPHQLLEIWLREPIEQSGPLNALRQLCESADIRFNAADKKQLDKLTGGANHQGAVARRRSPIRSDLENLVDGILETQPNPLFLALDQVQDPQNFGSCLRLADAAGVSGVIIPGTSQAPISGVVAKVASGALDSVPIVQINNLGNGLRLLKKKGVWVVGTDDAANEIYTDTDLSGATCLVLGSEGEGLRQRTRETCDFVVSIPMTGEVGSLNVANAAAVCLFEARRQRQLKPLEPG